jgi:hypothetical protein
MFVYVHGHKTDVDVSGVTFVHRLIQLCGILKVDFLHKMANAIDLFDGVCKAGIMPANA